LSNAREDTTCQRLLVSVVGRSLLNISRQIRNYIFSGYILGKVQEWPNMLWFYVCNSDLEFMIANKLQKKSNETTSPLVSSGLLLAQTLMDVLVRLSLPLNKLSVLYPMQSKG
jgi:hypothetical protein